MHNYDAEAVGAIVARALRLAGQRAVLLTGWDGLAGLPRSDDLFLAESVPHGWLFPRVAGVVHHGGAGTTAAAIRAGVPALVVPYMSDQPFRAQRVYELGVGPEPLPRRELSAERLAAGIRTLVADGALRRRAAELGRLVRAEDGVGRAADLLEAHLAETGGRPVVPPRRWLRRRPQQTLQPATAGTSLPAPVR
jgi:UDP:flavonoid glycosyltransferase YjiC (YdhE family)